jgi:hypothetical protein
VVGEVVSLNAYDERGQKIINAIADTFDENHFRRLLIRWIVYDNVSFSQCDSLAFREFISYLHPRCKDALPSNVSIRKWIVKAYTHYKQQVIIDLDKAPSKIHLAFNLWTSRNLLSLNRVVAHFINKDLKPQRVLLALPEQTGSHTGIDVTLGVARVIEEFGIQHKIGYFMLDNATNNDTALEVLG